MSIDYSAISGWGIEAIEEVCIKLGWDEECEVGEFLEDLDDSSSYLKYETTGNLFSGNNVKAWLLINEEPTLRETYTTIPKYIQELKDLGLEITEDEIIRVNEVLIY